MIWDDAFASSILSDLHIYSVEPTSSRLVITFVLDSELMLSEREIMEILKEKRGHPRSIVARAIHRKKVPELAFGLFQKLIFKR